MQKPFHSPLFRFGLIFILSLIEVMPVMLLTQAIPVILRQHGASVEKISFVYFAALPWALEFLWAPLVDRFGSRRYGRYRSWLLVLLPIVMLYVYVLGWLDFERLLLQESLIAYALLFCLTLVCATTDIASNGLATTLLKHHERGLGNGVQSAGFMGGHVVGMGLMLLVMDRFGWRVALHGVALSFAIPLMWVWFYRDEALHEPERVNFKEVFALFRRPNIPHWLLAMALVVLASSLMYTPLQVLLVDKGLTMGEVGLAMGTLGSSAGALGGFLGGRLVAKSGRTFAFYATGMVGAVLMLPPIIAAAFPVGKWVLYLACASSYAGMMSQYAVLYTLMMDRSRPHVASSDYSVQYSLLQLMGFVSMALGGLLACRAGLLTAFCATPLAMLTALLISRWLLYTDEINYGYRSQSAVP